MGLFPRPRLPAGRDFGPVRTCGAFPPTAARRAPFTKPRAATPSEVPAHPAFPGRGTMLRPLGCRDYLRFDLMAASIRKSRPEIKNRCTDCPCFDLFAASIRKSGPEIGHQCTEVHGMSPMAAAIANSGPEIENHCSAIVPASRTARLQKVVAATMPRPITIFVAASKNGPSAVQRRGCRRGQDATKAA